MSLEIRRKEVVGQGSVSSGQAQRAGGGRAKRT
jgi:hypothetical protein